MNPASLLILRGIPKQSSAACAAFARVKRGSGLVRPEVIAAGCRTCPSQGKTGALSRSNKVAALSASRADRGQPLAQLLRPVVQNVAPIGARGYGKTQAAAFPRFHRPAPRSYWGPFSLASAAISGSIRRQRPGFLGLQRPGLTIRSRGRQVTVLGFFGRFCAAAPHLQRWGSQ